MSYCRFSSDDYQCDVYCYADVHGGYTTHVASNRPVIDAAFPQPVPFDNHNVEAWVTRQLAVTAWVGGAHRGKIGLPHDGETFNDPDAASAADRLQMLKEAGYNVPQHAIDSLRIEAAEEASA